MRNNIWQKNISEKQKKDLFEQEAAKIVNTWKDQRKIARLENYGEKWLWQAIASRSKFIIGHVLGNRTFHEAEQLLLKVKQARGINNSKPLLLLSDNFDAYKPAIISVMAKYRSKPYKNRNSFYFKSYTMPDNLYYAVVVKERNSLGKIIRTRPRAIFGSMKDINAMLRTFFKKQKVNVSFIERLNLTDRMLNSRLVRKTITYSKEIEPLRYQLTLSTTYYNFCLPNAALKIPARRDALGRYRWIYRTPAMAEGLTSSIFSFNDLLLFNPNSHHKMT